MMLPVFDSDTVCTQLTKLSNAIDGNGFERQKMNFRMIQIAALTTAMLVPIGCKSLYGQIQGSTRNETIAGGVAGAIIGGIVGKQNDETPEGIAIGAALGALAGNAVGNSNQQMRAQEQAYRQAAYRQQVAQQQAQQQAFQRSASIQDVVEMTQNGVGSSVIMNHIRNVGVQQEIGVSEIITLHRGGVDQQVISMMQQLGAGRLASQPAVVSQPVVIEQVRPTYVQPVYQTRPSIVIEQYRPVPPPHRHPYHRPYGSRAYQNHLEFHYRR